VGAVFSAEVRCESAALVAVACVPLALTGAVRLQVIALRMPVSCAELTSAGLAGVGPAVVGADVGPAVVGADVGPVVVGADVGPVGAGVEAGAEITGAGVGAQPR
jgi:hypothetical protein